MRQIVVQHLVHRAAGFDDLIGRQTFSQQVVAGNGAVSEVDVRRVVHDATVRLFRHPLVKTAVARLHMKNRHLAPFGWNHRQTAVGVAEHQHGLGLHLRQHAVHSGDEIANGVGGAGAAFGAVQKIVWLAHTQVVKEHLVELVVVVLASVHQHMLAMLIQGGEHTRQANDLGPCAHHRHNLEFFHRLPVGLVFGGLYGLLASFFSPVENSNSMKLSRRTVIFYY